MVVEQAQLKVGQIVMIKSEVIRERLNEFTPIDFYFAKVLRLDWDCINLYRVFIPNNSQESYIDKFFNLQDIDSLVDGYSGEKT